MCTRVRAVEVKGHPQLSSGTITFIYYYYGLELAKYTPGWPATVCRGCLFLPSPQCWDNNARSDLALECELCG